MKYKNSIPPASARRFLRWFLRDDLAEEVQGDLEEKFYATLKKNSLFRTRINYWFQVLNYLRPFAIKKPDTANMQQNHFALLRHNFIISFRYFRRNATSFFINMLGLPAGIACALIIYLWVSDEFQVDKFHRNRDRLYQVMENVIQDGKTITRQGSSGPMSQALVAEMPEVESAVAIAGVQKNVLTYNETDLQADCIYADSDFFKIFSFDLINGNKEQALSNMNGIVITEELSHRIFGSPSEALGKVVELQHNAQFIVTAVIRNLPRVSTLKFDFIIPYAIYSDENEWVNYWDNSGVDTYLLLKPGADFDGFNKKIGDYIRIKTNGVITYRTPFATLFSESYLYNRYINGMPSGGRIEFVKLFSAIAVVILLIACINFMNLSTARASMRLKEIGIKKTFGAGRSALVLQYLGESMILSFLSLFVAIMLVYLLLPQFNLITGKQLSLGPGTKLLVPGLSIALLTGFISDSYPALYLSGAWMPWPSTDS
ncbi:MAG TPA: ABC transporter permease [Cyclobacteriaceae bacterium]|nr:ABC transporter permease [Cyclobacteriaceae bacterium]